ncbi:TPA: hypothetical protein N0F65_008432 [Lagenidium giganteum]|uniref:RING-type domain-containing protein n=1 Tax=Lagenidium giganteum TaxID=4803 RepID=A0AAV2YSP6_9STRA|nr:TPA: hypothetical protein N0F65_008432 [Lagenidium giganteum]
MATTRVRRWSDGEFSRRRRPAPASASCNGLIPTTQASLTPVMQAPPLSTAVGATSGSVITLSMKDLEVDDDVQECVICLDELELGKAIFRAECGHRFHFSCLLENVNHDEANADKCPICRKSQTQWPEQTEGLVKAHPYCTNCGKRGTGGQFCDGCGHSLAHTPTAQERARAAAAAAAARSNVVVECPSCRIRCLVSTSARGTLQCPNGHLFQLRLPPHMTSGGGPGPAPPINNTPAMNNSRGSFHFTTPPASSGPPASGGARAGPVMRQRPTCYTRVQMPPGSQAGQYMCPLGHTFYFTPYQ